MLEAVKLAIENTNDLQEDAFDKQKDKIEFLE